jgi:protein-S-isoprenylcysteine O-methyltransferase Ste14
MKDLNKKAFAGLLQFLIALAALLFLPAWTVRYWQAWVFLCVFSACVLAITLYLMKKDPKLLERRMSAGPGAEKEKAQKIVQSIASLAFIAVFVVSAFGHRLMWSAVPPLVSLAGDVLVALGLLIVFIVFRENSYTSGIVEVDPEQKVITTGPYAVVRHPMYSGSVIMLLGIPPALGSWWGLVAVAAITLVIVWRLLDEEGFLAKNLAGYSDYRTKVNYRLVPHIW